MFIQTESTPNPATVKFIPGKNIVEEGKMLDFASPLDATKSPLARRLFEITGVIRVFIAHDFISVSKADDTDWQMLKPMILAALMEHLSTNQPILDDDFFIQTENNDQNDSEIILQIKELLDERVRPMVAMDGGDIVFDNFDNGIVYLQMRGACSGCPSSTATLKMGIEKMLRHYIPEVKEVRPVLEF